MAEEDIGLKLNTDEAIAALRKLADAFGQTKGAAEQTGKTAATEFFKWSLAMDAAKKAATELWGVVQDSLAAYSEAERVERQLRVVAGESTEAFLAQATAIQNTLNVSDEMVVGLQTLALRHGVARQQVDGLVRATLDFAAATGEDATSALQKLIIGVDRGGERLQKMRVEYESTGNFTKDLDLATQALAKSWGGAAQANAESLTGTIEGLREQMSSLEEEFGKFLATVAKQTGVLDYVKEALVGWRVALFGSDTDEMVKRTEAHNALIKERGDIFERYRKAERDADALEESGTAFQIEQSRTKLADIARELDEVDARIAASEASRQAAGRAGAGFVNPGGGSDRAVGKGGSDSNGKALRDAFERVEKERVAIAEAQGELMQAQIDGEAEREERLEELRERMREARTQKERDEIEKRLELQRESHERHLEAERAWAEEVQQVQDNLNRFAEHSIARLAGVFEDQIFEMLTTNRAFSEEYQEKSLERRQADLEEQGIHRTITELRKEAESEQAAAFQKKTAEVLANLALEAGKNAVVEGAQAIAAAARYDFGAAALHGAAAAAFGVAAGVAGGAAYAISQSRGKTREERAQLEALERRDQAARERDERQRAQQDRAAIGTQVNVYNFGIAGQTETAQARELARIQREYGNLSLGG